MRRTSLCLALFGLVVLTSCSGSSPTAKPVPTVVPATWSITSLSASSSSPYVGNAVQLDAVVTKDGSPAPNGTVVEFLASGGGFYSSSGTSASVTTDGGTASALFLADTAGAYTIQARVQNVTRAVTVTYQGAPAGGALQIFQPLQPNRGSYDGGETVVLNGTGITAPVDVTFTVNGQSFPAVLQQIDAGDGGTGSITILTPYISGQDLRSEEREADVTVSVAVGTSKEQTQVLPNAFTFLPPAGSPTLYGVQPESGRARGGEDVTLLGSNLAGTDSVTFTFRSQNLTAQILSVAADGHQVLVTTPRFSVQPLETSEMAGVRLSTADGGSAELADAFLVLPDEPTPEIASLSPIAGPLDGGTLVTIFGSGFQMPLQVKFGNLTATEVNLFDDQSMADNDRITCLSPDYTQQGQTPPVAVDVNVTNSLSGKTSNNATFTYGDLLYITGNSPGEGTLADDIRIFGSGFSDPLQVFFTNGNRQLDPISVSGTQLLVRFPPETAPSCNDLNGQFQVTLIDSQNLTATGGNYTLLGNSPLITSVDPVYVGVGSYFTIHGSNFADNLFVEINNSRLGSEYVDVVDEHTIEVQNIPGLDVLGITFEQTACTAPGGVPGTRQTQTAVPVSVINLPGSCINTLPGALVFSPTSTDCEPTPADLVSSPVGDGDTWDFGSVTAAAGENTLQLFLTNNGGETATVVVPPLAGPDFSVTGTSPACASLTYGGPQCVVDVTFDPTIVQDGLTDTLVINYSSASAGGTITINLTGNGT